PFLRQLPVIVLMVVGVLVIESLGMYATAFMMLFLVSYWYSPPGPWGRRLAFSVGLALGFSALMYGLFSVLLKVQVPRGWLM
ncbi:MAG: tripartite tricarboxylate transporter TctB family protein, partial [Gammaproteobacteria bacterium]